MPSNVRRICNSAFLILALLTSFSLAQDAVQTSPQTAAAPDSGDVMRGRIAKAKALVVVRNYGAAIHELESIRKESGDPAVRAVVNVLLMNSYLEQGDYKRAQDFLNQFYNEQKTTKAGAADAYAAVAGQAIKGARTRAERYRTLGLDVADRTLPLEALNDLEKMRETLELVITQAKEISKTPARSSHAMALLEEASNSRKMIARDDYDAKLWKDAVADTREDIVNARSTVLSAISETTGGTNGLGNIPVTGGAIQTASLSANQNVTTASQPELVGTNSSNTSIRQREINDNSIQAEPKKDEKVVVVPSAAPTIEASGLAGQEVATAAAGDTIDVGSLVGYATRQTAPIYPASARAMLAKGLVKVEITVDEAGNVVDVKKTSGPIVLQSAARDAIKRWKFKPFVRDGQPVKANGFVNFNFSL